MEKTVRLFKNISEILRPPPKLRVSEWADEYRRLSKEASAEPGQWRTSRAPYQKEIMDAVNDAEVEKVIIMSSAQVGKALDITTKILTLSGWKLMKDIKAGDKVFDENGEVCNVTFATDIMHNRVCYSIIFSDGSEIIADEEHKWTVEIYKNGKFIENKTITTKEMLPIYKDGKRNNIAIPVTKPLKYKYRNLEIDPYVLGLWLGDGNSYSAQITSSNKDIEIVSYIEEKGYKTIVNNDDKRNGNILNIRLDPYIASDICIRGHDTNLLGKTKKGYCAECSRQHALKYKWNDEKYLDPVINKQKTFHSKLRKINLLANKHIPKRYLQSSEEQRMELLRGLMDSDGSISERGRASFSTTSEKISIGFSELLSSLGIKYTRKERYTKASNGKSGNKTKSWRFSFLVYSDRPIFKLKRKLKRMISREGRRTTETEKRRVVSIELIDSRPVKCISVDSKSRLYLAGETMIPTHNTELILNTIGYYVDYDPAPIMLVLPTLDLAEAFSKDRLAPMFRDTPALRNKIASNKSRDSNNTLLHKKFTGGHITLVGANSPSSLASRPIRILLADEVDRYPHSAGEEGDPIDLAAKRTTTFWNRKKVYVSTPTTKGLSRIEDEYESSTREQWCLPCPDCQRHQPLEWAYIKFSDTTMECRYCGERFNENEWKSGTGKWIAREPLENSRGFHLNELASPWKRWETIIAEFKKAKRSRETLKVWVNTSLGESWEEPSETDSEELYKRREMYNADVPEDVLVLTAGVDTQDDRLEVEVVGWGLEKESWGIEYKIFYGDPGQEQVWNQLDEYLKKQFLFENGQGIMISTTCIDTGGHFTTDVYKFCKPREHRRIYAIKGKGGAGIPLIGRVTRNNRERAALFTIGVDQGKQLIITRLKNEFEGPGYCHFPIEKEKGYDEKYFEGLTSERRVIKYSKGRPKVEWIVRDGARNEPFDIRNYATAALEILDPNLDMLKNQNKTGNIYLQKSQMSSNKVAKKKRRKVISKGL